MPAKKRKCDPKTEELEPTEADLLPFQEIQRHMLRILNKVDVKDFIEIVTCSRVVTSFVEANVAQIEVRLGKKLSISEINGFLVYGCPIGLTAYTDDGTFNHVKTSPLIGTMYYDFISIKLDDDKLEELTYILNVYKFSCTTLELLYEPFLDIVCDKIHFKKLEIRDLSQEQLSKIPQTCSHLMVYKITQFVPFSALNRFESVEVIERHGLSLDDIQLYVSEFVNGDRCNLRKLVIPSVDDDLTVAIPGCCKLFHGVYGNRSETVAVNVKIDNNIPGCCKFFHGDYGNRSETVAVNAKIDNNELIVGICTKSRGQEWSCMEDNRFNKKWMTAILEHRDWVAPISFGRRAAGRFEPLTSILSAKQSAPIPIPKLFPLPYVEYILKLFPLPFEQYEAAFIEFIAEQNERLRKYETEKEERKRSLRSATKKN